MTEYIQKVIATFVGIDDQEWEIITDRLTEKSVRIIRSMYESESLKKADRNNKKCKLTKSCTSALLRPRSWGGQHFYITGDNNLLMAKMHLGSSIAKVERIIKA